MGLTSNAVRLRTVIADEPESRAALRLVLGADEEIEVVEECSERAELLPAIERSAAQLVLLDVRIGGLSDLAALRVRPTPPPAFVLVAGRRGFSPSAFDVGAADYVLKPFRDARLRQAIMRAKQTIAMQSLEALRAELLALGNRALAIDDHGALSGGYAKRFIASSGTRRIIVPTADVRWIEAAADYVRIHSGARNVLLRCTMDAIEQRLNPHEFVRLHRSTIVKVDAIAEFKLVGRETYVVVLTDGLTRPVSNRGRERLRQMFDIRI